ncbi:hypothetical protein VNI00_009274 [Paramarasmius palmivorus]|uniref:Uncharacterized protein n=1 Tax=Paramarasmius palmivorus TaxID=297713 RepID=A0AAW0CUB6_9AGAR
MSSRPFFPPPNSTNLEPRPRSEIIGGIVFSPSEAIKWASELIHRPLRDNGDADLTAYLHIKRVVKKFGADLANVGQNPTLREGKIFNRQPFMVITQRRTGKFYNRCPTDCEEVTEEDLKMTPGENEELVKRKLEEIGGKFVNWCPRDCEEVTEEELKIEPGEKEEQVKRKLEVYGVFTGRYTAKPSSTSQCCWPQYSKQWTSVSCDKTTKPRTSTTVIQQRAITLYISPLKEAAADGLEKTA